MCSINHHCFADHSLKTSAVVCGEISHLEIETEKPYGVISPFAIISLHVKTEIRCCFITTCKNNEVLLVALASSAVTS